MFGQRWTSTVYLRPCTCLQQVPTQVLVKSTRVSYSRRVQRVFSKVWLLLTSSKTEVIAWLTVLVYTSKNDCVITVLKYSSRNDCVIGLPQVQWLLYLQVIVRFWHPKHASALLAVRSKPTHPTYSFCCSRTECPHCFFSICIPQAEVTIPFIIPSAALSKVWVWSRRLVFLCRKICATFWERLHN